MKNNKKGFTLIELMIVVAIIGILAAIAIPKFADLINKSKEGATKGSLSSVRSAINVYYGDNEGWYPADTLECLLPKYIASIPDAKLPGTGHADKNDVASSSNTITDAGGWAYNNDPENSTGWGTFVAACTHADIKGTSVWSTF
jgi:prepilin-type N-terminal cleavage/methylation domain-containing protein